MPKSAANQHGQFFNSLKQLEKRLKLENNPPPPTTDLPPPPPPPAAEVHVKHQENIHEVHVEHQENIHTTQNSDSLGTPMYLFNEHSANTSTSIVPETETPQEIISNPNFSSKGKIPVEENQEGIEESLDQEERLNLGNEIELMMQLLGLSDSEEPDNVSSRFEEGCDDEFYERIVGVKGPKNGKEVERLNGWIKHFLNGEVKEPFRLVHLLLGKAAVLHSGDNSNGFGELEFPCSVDEFLQTDPPLE